MPVTVQLVELGKDVFEIIKGIGTARMTRQTCDLPAGQIAENTLGECVALVLQSSNLVTDIQRIVISHQTQPIDFGLQVCNRLFEIKKIRVHGLSVCDQQSTDLPAWCHLRLTLRDQAPRVDSDARLSHTSAATHQR